jgi:parallel beta-helix repeat protein
VLALTLGACLTDQGSGVIAVEMQRLADAGAANGDGGSSPATSNSGKTVFVDAEIPSASCADYSVAARACGTGSQTAYNDPQLAVRAAAPGDTVMIRRGTFTRSLVLEASGSPGAPITLRSHQNETVVFTRIDGPAIAIQGRSHLVIEGLTVTDTHAWMAIEDSHDIIVRKNRFSQATARGSKGGVKLIKSHHNRIVGNVLEESNDGVTLLESDRNVVEGNDFRTARHSLLAVWCSSFNVVRGNRFANTRQKGVEVHDCDGQYGLPFKMEATKRNLFEANIFTHTRSAAEFHRYNGIQYAGQMGIVRRNVFFDNQGGALNHHVYQTEAFYNYGHRIYQNTFYANRCYGLRSSTGTGNKFPDTLIRGNLFYRNVDCSGAAVQAAMPAPGQFERAGNVLVRPSDDPGFVDLAKLDLRLRPDSRLVNTGVFLTRTGPAGNGPRLPVEDVWFFYDGFGIGGEVGDMIQLAGTQQRARVVGVDYVAGALKLDRDLSWETGQGVSLAFEGSAPEPGAYEVGVSTSRTDVDDRSSRR